MNRLKLAIPVLILLFSISIYAETGIESLSNDSTKNDSTISGMVLSPISNINGGDVPDDGGGAIHISWDVKTDSGIRYFRILRATEAAGVFDTVTQLTRNFRSYDDRDGIKDKNDYYYKIVTMMNTGEMFESKVFGPYQSKAQWFNKKRSVVLLLAVIFGFFILLYMTRAKHDPNLFIRRIAGLDALDDAVGRSTEMGKPIMYILGIGAITDLPTLAGLNILGEVSKKAFEYGTQVRVPCYDPVVMATAQEVVKQSAYEVGRPDAFNKNDIMYLTQDQFGYAAGCDGMMMREKPGAIFLQGTFYAEALILAETGHSVGAIQVAGTTQTAQLPFFVAACDYTLIGEEMLAASAYLSKDPDMVGTIKGEDAGKLIILLFILIMVILGSIGYIFNIAPIMKLFNVIKDWFTLG